MERLSTDNPIYTIGYGSRSKNEFIELLNMHQIAYLIDVRSVPYSAFKPEFSNAPLADTLKQHGIRYVFMGNTMGSRPDDKRCYNDNGKVDYEKIKSTQSYQHGIKRLHTAFEQQQAIVLMCSQQKPEKCHRSKLIGTTLTHDKNIPIIHIDEKGDLLTQEQVVERLTGGQLFLF